MKKTNMLFRVCTIILFAAMITSCKKNTVDPYAAYTPEREAAQIKGWKAAMKLKKTHIDSTVTGLYYVVDTTKIGIGPKVKAGNTVTVKYTGMFLDGTVFDASANYGDGTMTYIHKTDRLITGWEEGIELLNKGASAAFLIPSAKAYGATGYSIIPPNSPLIFVIEVINIK
jgi:FKBP-type peptidyl-prolyl cis-trans isomerase